MGSPSPDFLHSPAMRQKPFFVVYLQRFVEASQAPSRQSEATAQSVSAAHVRLTVSAPDASSAPASTTAGLPCEQPRPERTHAASHGRAVRPPCRYPMMGSRNVIAAVSGD